MNTQPTRASEGRVVLHVEDNVDHADLVEECLSRHDPKSRVVRAEDGAEALEYLAKIAGRDAPRPLLILLDLRLPRVDGIDVLRAVRETKELALIPVVILTTSDSKSDVARAYENHANGYLVKPDDFSAFDTMIKDLGCYWLEWNVQPEGRH